MTNALPPFLVCPLLHLVSRVFLDRPQHHLGLPAGLLRQREETCRQQKRCPNRSTLQCLDRGAAVPATVGLFVCVARFDPGGLDPNQASLVVKPRVDHAQKLAGGCFLDTCFHGA